MRRGFLFFILGLIAVPAAFGGLRFGLSGAVRDRVEKVDEEARKKRAEPPAVLSLVNAFPSLTFSLPVFLKAPPDGTDRLFVLEKDGRVLWFANDPATSTKHVALDLTATVDSNGEEGLLGMAFHPDFAGASPYVYLYYTAVSGARNVVARFTFDGALETADPGSALTILESTKPFTNHNGGMLEFGPDNRLYISIGDGGDSNDPDNNAQKLGSLLGKLLRIDVDGGAPYAVPADNPFISTPSARGEIWALGLRNPWRFSFDRSTGDLWLGDVGQSAREEVDIIRRGSNYGWSIREGFVAGPRSDPGGRTYANPVADHRRDEAASITGGYVYRGTRLSRWEGYYIYGDFITGRIWGLRRDGGSVRDHVLLAHSGLNISSFGEDRDGEIYAVSYGDGRIYAFRD